VPFELLRNLRILRHKKFTLQAPCKMAMTFG
jgi:hypothetical protein